MTRKDYELIAKVFKEIRNEFYRDMTDADTAHGWDKNLFAGVGVRILAENLAKELEQDNPRFDRQRFLDACGVAK